MADLHEGVGFGAKVLLDEVVSREDLLGPGNVLVFALGLYQAGNSLGNTKWPCLCYVAPYKA